MATTPPTTRDPEVEAAVGALASEHREDWSPAMRWLIDHGERSRAAVAELARSDRWGMDVKRAITVLGEIGHPEDVDLLARGLHDAEDIDKADYAHALALHGDARATEALIEATSADAETASWAAYGLGQTKAASARPVLEGLLDHDSRIVRFRTVLAIGDLGAGPSASALRRRLRVEKDPEIKAKIREVLAK